MPKKTTKKLDFTPGVQRLEFFMKPILSRPGYFASDEGEIYSTWVSGRAATPTAEPQKMSKYLGSHGYYYFVLKGTCCLVHRLVLEAFKGPCPKGMEGCHGPNDDKTDNRIENLRWDTRGNNNRDRMKNGWHPPVFKGEKHPRAKLTSYKVRKIRKLRKGGASVASLSKDFGVAVPTIKDVIKGRSWANV